MLLTIPKLIETYQKEYVRVNGKEIVVTYKKGWFRVGDICNARYYELHNMLETMQSRPNFVKA